MYAFLRRPRYLAFTLAIVAAIVVMIELGFWQLRRLDERTDRNALIEASLDRAPVALGGVLSPGDDRLATGTEWTVVSVTGRYDVSEQVLVRNRSFQGQPGYHLLTPLLIGDGATALVVNRGWIPLDGETHAPAPADGTVTVTGRLRPSQERGSLGPRDPDEGDLAALARADLDRLQQQVPYDLYPAYIELSAQDPPLGAPPPELVPIPELSDGPHLSYAVQWFLFSGLAVVGWVLVVRKTARRVPDDDPSRVDG